MSTNAIRERLERITPDEEKSLVHFVAFYTSSWEDAKECVYEAYVCAMMEADQIKDPDQLMSWLRTVAKRIALKDRHDKLYYTDQEQVSIQGERDMENAVLKTTLDEAIKNVIRSFPTYYGEILRLRYEDELSFRQIAAVLGISVDTARQAHHRLLKALRKELGVIPTRHR